MFIAAIYTIGDQGHQYGCLIKPLQPMLPTEAIWGVNNWKCMQKYFSFPNFGNPLYISAKNDFPNDLRPKIYDLDSGATFKLGGEGPHGPPSEINNIVFVDPCHGCYG